MAPDEAGVRPRKGRARAARHRRNRKYAIPVSKELHRTLTAAARLLNESPARVIEKLLEER